MRLSAANLLAAVLTTAGLTSAGLTSAGLTPAATPVAGVEAGTTPCLSAASDARVRAGSDGADPNSLTALQAAAMERRTSARLATRGPSPRRAGKGSPVTIKVHWHVITTANGVGNVTDARIAKQLSVLNTAYAGGSSSASVTTPFKFATASVDRTANPTWYDWTYGGTDDDQAKRALGINPQKELNVYLANLRDGLLGYATFPSGVDTVHQGVVLLNASLPGGSATSYNLGDTATHEIGHWLGLYHTFQGGCVAPGDSVSDTPYQADGDNIYSCVESLDTCRATGKDPVHNFMSYGDDACLNRFTAGQSTRMTQQWNAWRA